MVVKIVHSFFLTFDTEDFISGNSVPGLHAILEHLRNKKLTALFFVTGHMAEKLSNYPATVNLLNEHQIGYHSSSHSVHPTLFEFTDIVSYEKAYQISLARETSHVNPLTGELEGKGGIYALQSLFPKKQILAFRAPGYCWSPPHLDAMKTLGIIYDFSTNMSINPISYRGMTFFPFTLLTNWRGGIREQSFIQRQIVKRETSVLTIHPSTMVNQTDWDSVYYPKNYNSKLNPDHLKQPRPRSNIEVASIFNKFDLLLKQLAILQSLYFLRITPEPEEAIETLHPNSIKVEEYYKASIKWMEGFGYNPKYLRDHFSRFFNLLQEEK